MLRIPPTDVQPRQTIARGGAGQTFVAPRGYRTKPETYGASPSAVMQATYLSPANFFPSVHFLSAAMRWALMVFGGAGGGLRDKTHDENGDKKSTCGKHGRLLQMRPSQNFIRCV